MGGGIASIESGLGLDVETRDIETECEKIWE